MEDLYISYYVDGNDARWVSGSCTMVRCGLHQAFVSSTIEVLGEHFQVLGADVVRPDQALVAGVRVVGRVVGGHVGAAYEVTLVHGVVPVGKVCQTGSAQAPDASRRAMSSAP